VGVGCNSTGQPTAGVQSDVCCRLANSQIPFHLVHPVILGKDRSVDITKDSLQVGRSGDRYPVEARFSAPLQTVPGPRPASYKMDNGSLSRR
jgi:hypothetical protein